MGEMNKILKVSPSIASKFELHTISRFESYMYVSVVCWAYIICFFLGCIISWMRYRSLRSVVVVFLFQFFFFFGTTAHSRCAPNTQKFVLYTFKIDFILYEMCKVQNIYSFFISSFSIRTIYIWRFCLLFASNAKSRSLGVNISSDRTRLSWKRRRYIECPIRMYVCKTEFR